VFESLVVPQKIIPAKITKIDNITQAMVVENGRELESVLKEFREFVGDLRLVTFNSKFDMAFLNSATSNFGYKIENPVSCALKMARRAWPGLKSYKLIELAKLGGLSSAGTHRALKDAELTVTVYTTAVHELGEIE
jgi:DNA polymerase III epsilon subunit-like protein